MAWGGTADLREWRHVTSRTSYLTTLPRGFFVEKLAVYTTSQFPHVGVEACDTCRRYIKTVDLTKNGHAAPVVDELGTVPLNLWAEEHQYTKLQPNLLGI